MAQRERRQERDQSRTIHPVPVAARGISDQPPHLRLPGQMENASNCHVSVVDGTSKRPGTQYMTPITAVGGVNFRIFGLKIDASESYIIMFGKPAGTMLVRMFRVASTINWTEASVTISALAQTYLNTATADTLRVVPVKKDETLLISTVPTMIASTATAATFSLTATWRDYGVMVAQTPADNTYHRATNEDVDEDKPAGYYKYSVGGVTFAKIQFPAVSGREPASVVGIYDDTASSPMGFTIRCRKYDIAFTNGTWTQGTLTLTKVNAFLNYSFQNGDQIHIAATGGLAAGYYTITNRLSADAITLASTPGPDTALAQVVNGVSVAFDVQRSTDGVALADMYAVAESFQDAFRAAGADQGLVGWTPVGTSGGYFTITSPFRTSGATILEVGAPSTGANLSSAGNGFNPTGATITAGTGSGSLTFDVANRWTQVSPSGASDGSIDNTTFPVRLLRTAANTFKIDLITPTPRDNGDGTTNPTPSLFRKSGLITAVTVTNPAVITSLAHARRTGDALAITGLSGAPGIPDATYTITKIDDDSYSIPIAGAATGTGSWTMGGAAITDAVVHRGRLGLIGGAFFVLSRANDFYNFYLADYRNIVDSDPIDAPLGGREVPSIDFIADFRGTLIAFSTGGRQYEFGTPELLTPSSASWTARSRYSTYSIRPVLMGPNMYFLGPRTNKSVAWEMYYDDTRLIYDASEITAHCRDVLPMSLRSFIAGVNEYVLIVLPTGNGATTRLMVYRAFWDGIRKDQSEWVEYAMDDGVRICDMTVIDGDAYLLTETTGLITAASVANPTNITTATNHGLSDGNQVYISESNSTPTIDGTRIVTVTGAGGLNHFTIPVNVTTAGTAGRWSLGDYMIEKLSLSREDPMSGYPFTIHLDRRVELTGTNAASVTTWNLPFPAQGSTLNFIVLKTSGTVLSLSGATYGPPGFPNRITIPDVPGAYAGVAYLGRNFGFLLQLTPPFLKDGNGVADQDVSILLANITVAYQNSGDFSVRVDYDDTRADISTNFVPTGILGTGRFRALTRCDGEHATIFIESSSPKQLTISSYQQEGDYAFGLR